MCPPEFQRIHLLERKCVKLQVWVTKTEHNLTVIEEQLTGRDGVCWKVQENEGMYFVWCKKDVKTFFFFIRAFNDFQTWIQGIKASPLRAHCVCIEALRAKHMDAHIHHTISRAAQPAKTNRGVPGCAAWTPPVGQVLLFQCLPFWYLWVETRWGPLTPHR